MEENGTFYDANLTRLKGELNIECRVGEKKGKPKIFWHSMMGTKWSKTIDLFSPQKDLLSTNDLIKFDNELLRSISLIYQKNVTVNILDPGLSEGVLCNYPCPSVCPSLIR